MTNQVGKIRVFRTKRFPCIRYLPYLESQYNLNFTIRHPEMPVPPTKVMKITIDALRKRTRLTFSIEEKPWEIKPKLMERKMICPYCRTEMIEDVEPDEKSDGTILGYPVWRCPKCDFAEDGIAGLEVKEIEEFGVRLTIFENGDVFIKTKGDVHILEAGIVYITESKKVIRPIL